MTRVSEDARRQNTFAYAAQAVSMVALGVSNFVIPYIAGHDAYGRLAVVQASVFASVGLVSGASAQFLIGRGRPEELRTRMGWVVRVSVTVWAAYAALVAGGVLLQALSQWERACAVLLAAALPVGTLAYGIFAVTNRTQRLLPATMVNGVALSALPIAGYLLARGAAGLVLGYATAFWVSGTVVVALARPVLAALPRERSPARPLLGELFLLVLVNMSGSIFVWVALWITSGFVGAASVAVDRILLSVVSATVALMPLSRFVIQNLAKDGRNLERLVRNGFSALAIAAGCTPVILPHLLALFRVPADQATTGSLVVSLLLGPHFAGQVLASTLVGAGRVRQVAGASVVSTIVGAIVAFVSASRDVALSSLWGTLAQGVVFSIVSVIASPEYVWRVLRTAFAPLGIAAVALLLHKTIPEGSLATGAASVVLIAAYWFAGLRRAQGETPTQSVSNGPASNQPQNL